jgi:hypothetical protein
MEKKEYEIRSRIYFFLTNKKGRKEEGHKRIKGGGIKRRKEWRRE